MNGMIEPHSEPRIYLNTNVFIEMFERGGAVSDSLLRLFAGPQRPRYHIVTSQLPIAEVLVAPIRDDDMQRHDLYQGFLQDIPNLMTIVPISRQILIRAALIRARQVAIKLPDAIHLATAREQNCRIFVSNDSRIRDIPYFDRIVPLEIEALERLHQATL
jgi:predicted nucleic acid-binding protein